MSDPNVLDETLREADEPEGSSPRISQALLELLPGRDPQALSAFFDAYFDRVYGYVRRLVRDEHLAEDLSQDVFMHIYKAIPTYDPARSLRPWVFTIATNKVRDFWRSRRHRESQKEQSVEREGAVDNVSGGAERPDTNLTRHEMDERVRRAVDELPEGMRMTVLLRVYEGMSFEAIGAILDRSEVAVRKRYSRALDTLRASLGSSWQTHSEGS
jgi:RNA polymerase sigma-70 factor (ECF subfamily)